MTEANGGDAAERLNRYWDDLLRDRAVHPGGPAAPAAGLDLDLAAAVRRLHALDDAPAPDPVLAARLWPALVSPAADAPATGDPTPVTAGAHALRLVHPALGRPLVELIAAALLLAVLGGSLGGRGGFPSLSGPVPTASAQETTATAVAATACLPSPTPWADSPAAPLGLADARPTSASTQRGCD